MIKHPEFDDLDAIYGGFLVAAWCWWRVSQELGKVRLARKLRHILPNQNRCYMQVVRIGFARFVRKRLGGAIRNAIGAQQQRTYCQFSKADGRCRLPTSARFPAPGSWLVRSPTRQM